MGLSEDRPVIGGSGRCHGPNCTREEVVEFWCGEACKAAWDRQVAGLPAPKPPVLTARLTEVTPTELRAAVDAARPELDRQFAEAIEQATTNIDTAVPPAGPSSRTPVQDVLAAYELIRQVEPPAPVKLTVEQYTALRENTAGPSRWQAGPSLSPLFGAPVEIVETVEESTPYLLERRKQFERAAIAAGRRMPWRPAGVPYQVEPAGSEPEPQTADASTEFPQVGFLTRAFHWLFGRTT